MSKLMVPETVMTDFPEACDPGSTARVNMYTRLFRSGCYLPETLAASVDRLGLRGTLKVASIGCSNGAEVDSLLALHKRAGYAGRLAITGYDINALAIDEAESEFHETDEVPLTDQEAAALEQVGFEVLQTAHCTQIFTYSLRKEHEVRFQQHDARQPWPVEDKFDLVLANNLLYHFRNRGKVMAMIDNFCQLLEDNGVISFGSTFAYSDKFWRQKDLNRLAVAHMANKFGLRPIFYGHNNVPAVFARS